MAHFQSRHQSCKEKVLTPFRAHHNNCQEGGGDEQEQLEALEVKSSESDDDASVHYPNRLLDGMLGEGNSHPAK